MLNEKYEKYITDIKEIPELKIVIVNGHIMSVKKKGKLIQTIRRGNKDNKFQLLINIRSYSSSKNTASIFGELYRRRPRRKINTNEDCSGKRPKN